MTLYCRDSKGARRALNYMEKRQLEHVLRSTWEELKGEYVPYEHDPLVAQRTAGVIGKQVSWSSVAGMREMLGMKVARGSRPKKEKPPIAPVRLTKKEIGRIEECLGKYDGQVVVSKRGKKHAHVTTVDTILRMRKTGATVQKRLREKRNEHARSGGAGAGPVPGSDFSTPNPHYPPLDV